MQVRFPGAQGRASLDGAPLHTLRPPANMLLTVLLMVENKIKGVTLCSLVPGRFTHTQPHAAAIGCFSLLEKEGKKRSLPITPRKELHFPCTRRRLLRLLSCQIHMPLQSLRGSVDLRGQTGEVAPVPSRMLPHLRSCQTRMPLSAERQQ